MTDSPKKNSSENQEKPTRFKTARVVGSEISGITFIKRGVAAQIRAGKQGLAVLKYGASNFLAQTKPQPLVDPSDIDLVERQIKQANSLYSAITWFTAVVLAFTMLAFSSGYVEDLIGASLQGFTIVNLFSLSIGGLATIYFLLSGYLSLRDFKNLTRITPAPKGLVDQYRATYVPLASALLIMNTCAVIMQLAPGLSYERAIFGFVTCLATLSVIRAARMAYDPTKPAMEGNTMFKVFTKVITGRSFARSFAEDGRNDSHPTAILIIVLVFTAVNLYTKESSLVSIFNLFGVLIGLSALLAISIHAWGLKRV